MITLEYKILIHATPEKVWDKLWEPTNYETWTSTFTKGSHYKTESLIQGARIHFMNENKSGMYSNIDQMVPNQYMAFKHIGILDNGDEKPIDEETSQWSGSLESYELIPDGDNTNLIVKVETFEAYVDSMENSFPKALESLKNMAEK